MNFTLCRFGESQLHYCEVMLKDVYDSKRINAHLHSDPNFKLDRQQFPSTAMILSAQFWPPFKEETLELPDFVKEHLQIYTKAFETLKVIFLQCTVEIYPITAVMGHILFSVLNMYHCPYFFNIEEHTVDEPTNKLFYLYGKGLRQSFTSFMLLLFVHLFISFTKNVQVII